MMDIIVICNDGGEMKTVTAAELKAWADAHYDERGRTSLLMEILDEGLNAILDRRAIDAGEYDPSDNETPIFFTLADRS